MKAHPHLQHSLSVPNFQTQANNSPPTIALPHAHSMSDLNAKGDTKKKKKGDLQFRANFESGNLNKVHVVQDGFEYDLYIRPDTNNANYRLWYYFCVSNAKKNQRVLFTICNFSKQRSLYRQGMAPIVKSTSRPHWECIPSKQVYYYKSYRHGKTYVLSFSFLFDQEDEDYYFAYSFPYTYTDLQRFLHGIEVKQFPYFRRELLGRTVQYRRMDLLTITDFESTAPKKTIAITARIHPGETPASYVCHGLISFLLSDHSFAKMLREIVVFKIIPMLNPDGVFLGNYRCSSMGYDLNRQWMNPASWAHPEIALTRECLLKMSETEEIDFYIDLHSHSTATSSFMFVNLVDSSSTREETLILPKLLDMRAKEFQFADTKCCKDPLKLGTGRRTIGELLKIAKHCYTLEMSFYSYLDPSDATKLVPLNEFNYLELGKNLGLSFLEFYRITQNSSFFLGKK